MATPTVIPANVTAATYTDEGFGQTMTSKNFTWSVNPSSGTPLISQIDTHVARETKAMFQDEPKALRHCCTCKATKNVYGLLASTYYERYNPETKGPFIRFFAIRVFTCRANDECQAKAITTADYCGKVVRLFQRKNDPELHNDDPVERRLGMCAACGKLGRVMRCAKCAVTGYCNQECQKKDWPRHKKVWCKIAIEETAIWAEEMRKAEEADK